MSLAANLTSALLRLYTYPYRKAHASLSRSIKLKSATRAPKGTILSSYPIAGMTCKVLTPKKTPLNPPLLFIHGGGVTQPLSRAYMAFAAKLSRLMSAEVFMPDYPTDPEATYPLLHDTIYDFYVKFQAETPVFYACGDSYGANFLLSALFRARSESLKLPERVALVSPFIDMSVSGDSYRLNAYHDPMYGLIKRQSFNENEKYLRRQPKYIGSADALNPDLSPLFAGFSDFVPTLIQVGEYETSLSDSETLSKRLDEAGVKNTLSVYRKLWHDFQIFTPFIPESKTAIGEIADFLLKSR